MNPREKLHPKKKVGMRSYKVSKIDKTCPTKVPIGNKATVRNLDKLNSPFRLEHSPRAGIYTTIANVPHGQFKPARSYAAGTGEGWRFI